MHTARGRGVVGLLRREIDVGGEQRAPGDHRLPESVHVGPVILQQLVPQIPGTDTVTMHADEFHGVSQHACSGFGIGLKRTRTWLAREAQRRSP